MCPEADTMSGSRTSDLGLAAAKTRRFTDLEKWMFSLVKWFTRIMTERTVSVWRGCKLKAKCDCRMVGFEMKWENILTTD